MKSKFTVLTTCLLIMAVAANSQTKQTMEKQNFTLEQNEVMKVILDMTEAFHKKDLEGVLASYEPNAVIVFEPEKTVSGTEAIGQGFQGFFAVNPKFVYSGHEVFINGNLAMHFAPWTMTGKTPDGQEIKQSGLSVVVLRKQENGKWLMVFDNPFGQYLIEKH